MEYGFLRFHISKNSDGGEAPSSHCQDVMWRSQHSLSAENGLQVKRRNLAIRSSSVMNGMLVW